MIVGALSAILLVLVSPNMTYPLVVKPAQEKIIKGAEDKLVKLNASLAEASDPAAQEKIQKDIAVQEKAKKGAETAIANLKGETTSIMGLEKPLFDLKNPGLISIPLGFLCVIIGSLLYRDKRADDMWDELYVRQNTGILAAEASH
jgi:cation/acetate symporter